MPANPVVQPSGIPGAPMLAPAFTSSGYAPAIKRLADDYSKWLMESVSAHVGGKGLLKSSVHQNLLSRAGGEGFRMAMQDFTTQQQVFSPYVNALLGAKLEERAQPAKQPWWQRSIMGAAQGAVAGGMIGGGPGAGIGAIAGAIAGPSIY